jgi:3',5'-nucleoside bisphosphate phosphatase
MYVDLHIHTAASDGTWDTDELMAHILAAEISLFAITDHDTLKNSRLMRDTLSAYPDFHGQFVVGTEVSCTWNGVLYHLTAYDVDPDNPALQDLLAANRQTLRDQNDALLKAISEMPPGFDYARYLAYEHDRKRGGWKGLCFLFDAGIIRDLDEFFQLVRTVNLTTTFRDPATVISAIRNAGGYAFMAHPTAVYREQMMPAAHLRQWMELGLTGLECYSTYCTPAEAEAYAALCRQHRLSISAGSDCHGMFILERRLGHPRVTPDMVDVPFLGR